MRKLVAQIAVVIIALLFVSCARDRIRASGNVISLTREVRGEFDKLSVSDGIRAFVTMSDIETETLTVEADDNIQAYIETYVINGEMRLKLKDHTVIKGRPTIRIYLKASALSAVSGSGGSQTDISNGINSESFRMGLSGGSRLSARINSGGSVTAEISGGSRSDLSGTCTTLNLHTSGGSRFTGYSFAADMADLNASGGSNIELSVDTKLDVTASGGSNIKYKGSPQIGRRDVTSDSKLTNID